MKVGYIDTSVLVGIAFHDPGGAFVSRAVKDFDRLYSSTLIETEFLVTAHAEGVGEKADDFMKPIRLVHPSRTLRPEIAKIEEHGMVRGPELHHLATALYLFSEPGDVYFLSLIDEQTKLAATLGFKTDFL